MEGYDEVAPIMKEKIRDFILTNVDSIYNEQRVCGTNIEIWGDDAKIVDNLHKKSEYITRDFVGYKCNVCGEYITQYKSDYDLIAHAKKHINGEI